MTTHPDHRSTTPRSRRLWFAVAAATLAAGTLATAGPAYGSSTDAPGIGARHGAADGVPEPPDTVVTAWDAIGTRAFSAAALTPAEGFTIFSYVAIAVYDSVVAVEGTYEPFTADVDAPHGASVQGAVVAAAHRVLSHYLPAQVTSILDPAYAASLAELPADQRTADGVHVGENVADLVIAARAGDGFRAPVTYTAPNPPIPGAWIPTAATPPIGTYVGRMRPFTLDSPDQFRPGGPPSLRTRKWAREYNEVKEIGSATSTTRTPEQTLAARFWAEPPVQQARGSFRAFVNQHQLDTVEAARFMAMISVTYADAFMACFDAKYHYAFWRPVTAIRAGDTDDNARTVGDPAWSPLLAATPNHPEYTSAHSCVTPAGARVMARFLGTRQIDLTIPSLTGLGDRHYANVAELETEVTNARIWGGIHYRSAVDDGVTIARRVARHVLAHHFRAGDC